MTSLNHRPLTGAASQQTVYPAPGLPSPILWGGILVKGVRTVKQWPPGDVQAVKQRHVGMQTVKQWLPPQTVKQWRPPAAVGSVPVYPGTVRVVAGETASKSGRVINITRTHPAALWALRALDRVLLEALLGSPRLGAEV